jgi:hypothetical protein
VPDGHDITVTFDGGEARVLALNEVAARRFG